MILESSALLSFASRITPTNPGDLASYRAGLSGFETNIALPLGDEIILHDTVIAGDGSFVTWEIQPRSGVYANFFPFGGVKSVTPWWRNPEEQIVFLDRLYAISVHMISDDAPKDFYAGSLVQITGAHTLGDNAPGEQDPHVTQIKVPTIAGYIEGMGAWMNAWPQGLILNPAAKILLFPQYAGAVYTLRWMLLGRGVYPGEWSPANTYAVGDLSSKPVIGMTRPPVYYCKSAHFSTDRNEPAEGADWQIYWRVITDTPHILI
jgi:hypothetical protein